MLVMVLLCFMIIILRYVPNWITSTFGEVTFAQLIFNVLAPTEGADLNTFYQSFLNECIIVGIKKIAILILLLFLGLYLRKFIIKINLKSRITSRELINIRIYMPRFLPYLIIMILFIGSCYKCLGEIGLYSYIEARLQKSSLYEDYYVDASTIDFEFPETKQNLIYISLESVETTYFDSSLGGAQEINLMPELSDLALENITFVQDYNVGGFLVSSGAGWTVAALTAQNLGVPLCLPVNGNAYSSDEFLPGAYGIGDILEAAGYNQVFLLGSDASFAGRDVLYTTHGNYEIKDYNYAIETGMIPEDYYEWWGYEDQYLFEFAKEELLELASQDAPFNFATLTTDTHFEDGYVCPDCSDTYDCQYSNVIACSSARVSEFVSWIQEQDFYENTTIVIVADHLSMDSDFFLELDEDYVRRGYFTIINSAADLTDVSFEREYTSLDIFPTTIASLGITWEGDSLGLGTNLYSDSETLVETLGFSDLNAEINKSSTFYDFTLLYEK